jgi:DNA gyrase/topoisomerase IV subunit B
MSYNAKSIQQLTFRQGVRKRVGIYLGSADHTGVMAGLLELVNNATDEALVCPTANKIEIEIGPDWASCRDYGRGMPHGENDFSKEVMINLLTENHSGAKFDDNAYGGKSRGLNGTGSAATCCSSDWFKISSYRDGAEWYMEFEEGIPKWDVCQKRPLNGNKNGTYICYKPSQEVFSAEPIHFNYEEICEQMKEYSYFNKGITFIIKDATTGETKTYMSKNGLMDFVKENLDKPIHKAPLHYVNSENGIDVEIILQWTSNREEKFYLFSNGGENENGGTPITGIKTALTNFFKKKLKGEAHADILRKGLVYVCSVNLKDPIYDGQTKSKITNPELRGLCQRATTQMLESFEQQHADEFQRVLDLLAKEQKAELAAERARKQVLEAQKEVEKSQKKKYIASDKLKDAEFLGQDATLLIVEGNSAMASVGVARDEKTYGIMCIRGKIINALSNDEEKIYQNEEIKLLLSALNIVPGHYDSRKLRYGRVGVCTDSDSDGYHIGLLLMAALQYLAPQFIEEGRLGWLRSPLYIVKNGKTENYYFTDEEMDVARGHISGVIQRNKGIGSLTPEQAYNSMFTAKNQRFDMFQTSPEARELLYNLMGKDVEPRTDFIFKNVDFSMIRE